MTGEYDEKFKEITVVLQKMQKSVGGIDLLRGGLDELRLEVRDMRKELRDVRNEVSENTVSIKSLGQKVEILSGHLAMLAGWR